MNPQKRFGQLEEIMAEMLQKQDRLETLAVQTFEVAFNADTKVETLNEKVDALDEKLTTKIDAVDEKLTAKIDAVDEKLTAKIDAVDEKLTAKIDAVDEKLTTKIDAVDEKLTARTDTIARAVADLTVDNQREHQKLNDKLDGIMAYLKEKFG